MFHFLCALVLSFHLFSTLVSVFGTPRTVSLPHQRHTEREGIQPHAPAVFMLTALTYDSTAPGTKRLRLLHSDMSVF